MKPLERNVRPTGEQIQTQIQAQTRRHFFRQSTAGIGGLALSSLLAQETPGAAERVRSACQQAASLRSQGEASDLFAHDRIAAKSGSV